MLTHCWKITLLISKFKKKNFPVCIQLVMEKTLIFYLILFLAEDVKGVPHFWLTVFKNVDMLSEMVQVKKERGEGGDEAVML